MRVKRVGARTRTSRPRGNNNNNIFVPSSRRRRCSCGGRRTTLALLRGCNNNNNNNNIITMTNPRYLVRPVARHWSSLFGACAARRPAGRQPATGKRAAVWRGLRNPSPRARYEPSRRTRSACVFVGPINKIILLFVQVILLIFNKKISSNRE